MSSSGSMQSASHRRDDGASPSTSRRSGSRRRRRIRRRWPLFAAAAVVGLAVLGGVGWLLWGMFAGSEAGQHLPHETGVYPNGATSDILTDREVDPRELSEAELFERGAEELDSQGITFTLEESALEEDCAAAVWGSRPTEALADADCTQVARAAYLADDYVGMVALFNLADTEAAQRAAESLEPEGTPAEPEDGDGFLTLLSEEGDIGGLGAGYSAAEIIPQGHYLMVVWTQERGAEADSEEPERVSLAEPMRTLTNFEMALFRRLLEHEEATEEDEDLDVGAEEGAGQEDADGE